MNSKEALNKLISFIPREKSINSEFNKQVDELVKVIREDLEESIPSFEDIVKEWNDNGFRCTVKDNWVVFSDEVQDTVVRFDTFSKFYVVKEYYSPEYSTVNHWLHRLIDRTVKALKLFDNGR